MPIFAATNITNTPVGRSLGGNGLQKVTGLLYPRQTLRSHIRQPACIIFTHISPQPQPSSSSSLVTMARTTRSMAVGLILLAFVLLFATSTEGECHAVPHR